MADKIEYSRLLMKRSTQSGEVPTVPPITATTLNQFTPTDVFVGEFFLNAVDDLLWIRTDNGILPIDLSGSTGTTIPSLNQVLFQGNETQGLDILVTSGDTIVFGGLVTGSTTQFLGLDVSGNTIVSGVMPGTPDLQSVLFQGNQTNGTDIEVSSGDTIQFLGLSSGSTTDILGVDASGNTIVTTVSTPAGLYLPLSGGTVTGNTYFGATSGITMDQVNSRIGVRTSAPEYYVDLFGTKSRIYYADTSGGVLQMTGDTFLPRYSIAAAATITKPLFSLSMGVRTWDDTTFPGYGKIGDTFIYSSNEANGMNIINRQGTGTEDYIQFYAGQDANGTTADMHIQGSGATRGYIGMGTETPVEKLDVIGNVKMTGDLTIGTIGGTTPVINLGLDANGLVVTGTTGGGGDTLWTSGTSVGSVVGVVGGNVNTADYALVVGLANNVEESQSGLTSGNIVVGSGNTFDAVISQLFGYDNYLGGLRNFVAGTQNYLNSADSAIIGGSTHEINSPLTSFIGGGRGNKILGTVGAKDNAIIGGDGNILNQTDRSVIIGGQDITGTTDDMVYVPDLTIVSATTGTSIASLGIDSTGKVIKTTGGGNPLTVYDASSGVTATNVTGMTFSGASVVSNGQNVTITITGSTDNFVPYNIAIPLDKSGNITYYISAVGFTLNDIKANVYPAPGSENLEINILKNGQTIFGSGTSVVINSGQTTNQSQDPYVLTGTTFNEWDSITISASTFSGSTILYLNGCQEESCGSLPPSPTPSPTPTPTPTPSPAPSFVTSGLALHLDANNSSSYNGSGTIWYDLTANNNDALLTGSTLPIYTASTPSYFNVNQSSLVGSYFIVNNSSSIQFTTGMTFEFWVYVTTANASYKTFLNKQDPDTWSPPYGDYALRLSSSSTIEVWATSYFNRGTTTYNLVNAWKQIVFTWDNSSGTYKLYENGIFITDLTGGNTSPAGTSTYPLWIGDGIAGEPFSGRMSIIRLYNRPLSSGEVTTNFNYNKSTFGL